MPAVDRLGMPLVTSGQFAYVYKLKSASGNVAVRCFRGYLRDRDERYEAIQNYLQSHFVAGLSEFHYASEGILVGDRRFPILFMEWIDGPTLDFYLEEMISRKEVLEHLSSEWLRLVKALADAGIAHGDLQHGNIIVDHGSLRLIDHDGIFVPQMTDWSSSEVGHQHYQHPKRAAFHFDATLDHFSSIVIYLTLISLAERPELWQQYHDENLLFTKSDFLEPASSQLFAKIREIGPDHARVAHALAEAAAGPPDRVPSLFDLVELKQSLPTWMNAPLNLESHTKTREVKLAPAVTSHPRWIPWSAATKSTMPSTPPSSTVQTLFGGPAAPFLAAQLLTIQDPTDVWRNTPIFAKEIMKRLFIVWYWGIFVFLNLFGVSLFASLAVGLVLGCITAFAYGYVRSLQLSRATMHATLSATQAQVAQGGPTSPVPSRPAIVPQQVSITQKDPVVGNSALNIFHATDCDWVKKIVTRNRVTFPSTFDALHAGYKPCQVCSPTT